MPNEEKPQRGSGFPRLLLTGNDIDPSTGELRQGDIEQPALWQEVADYKNNVWWLNLENPAALFHFRQRDATPQLWRSFHAQRVVEMVQQVHMQEEFSRRSENIGAEEQPEVWVSHKAAMERFEVQLAPAMWERLDDYVQPGQGLDA